MLFFQFNKDNFAISKNESCEFDFGQVQNFFLEKFKDELCLDRIEKTSVFYDILGIPIDAFSIDDEALCNLDGVLKFALSEYVKLPIKELNNKSLSDLGIQIEFCKRESNKIIDMKIERYMKENNSRYLNEDILWKNMNDKEKIYKFLDKLIKIESKNNELIIVDPFIFSDDDDGYCNMLNCILNESKAKNIIIVTKEK